MRAGLEADGGSRQRSLRVRTVAALAAFAVIAVATPAAYARTAHSYESVITEVPGIGPGGSVPTPGSLGNVDSMTVFSGDLYVAEHLAVEASSPNARTDQWAFNSKLGEYEFVSQLPPQPEPRQNRAVGIALGSTAGKPYLYIGQAEFFTTQLGVNVFADPCGNLECASFQTLWTGASVPPSLTPFEGVAGVAVDHSTGTGTSAGDWASGDVFVNAGGGGIDIFETEASGVEHYVEQVSGVSGPVAVSGFNGDLVVGDEVLRPEEEGAKKGKYGFACRLELSGGPLEGISAVAVDGSTAGSSAGEIYVATSGLESGSVYEFGPECAFRGDITSLPKEGVPGGLKGQTEEVPFGAIRSVAVDAESHRVFVGEQSPQQSRLGVVDVFGPDAVIPDVVTGSPGPPRLETDPATGADSWRVEATGEVNPDNAGQASCGFVWGLTETFGSEARCSEPVENGSALSAVNGSLAQLEPDSAYVYRLQATNANGTNHGKPSQDVRFTTPGPGLRSESASEVSSTGASLEATVAPHDAPSEEHDFQAPTSAPTSYFFQYSTQSTSVCAAEPGSCVSVPLSPASVGAGTADAQVSQHLAGLTPNTTYHYRLVAENEALPASMPGKLIAFYAPDRTFTTQGAGGAVVLPDGRAWELVSPADKLGAKIYPSLQNWASEEGSRFTFLTNIPTEPEPPGAGAKGVQVLASRVAPGRWSSVDINLSHSGVEGALPTELHGYKYFSPDLGLGIADSEGPFSIPEGNYQNERGEWERIVEASPVPTERTSYLRHNSTCAAARATCYEPLLYPEDVTSGKGIEGGEYAHGATYFAGATPDARHVLIGSSVQLTTEPAKEGGLYEWSAGQPPAERLSLVGGRSVAGLSPDGSRVLFAPGGLYLRDVTRSETVRLDLTESGAAPSGGIGSVAGTSTDLSRVFFTDATVLTSRSGAEGSSDLYVCELGPEGPGAPKCALTDLTPARPTGKGNLTEAAQVSQALKVSPDGSYVYFLAKGVQAAGAPPGEGEREDVYVAHEHEGKWVTSFIASAHVSLQAEGTESVISPDGRWLAFSSSTPLTGYDNRDAKTGSPDSEVYLYDAQTGGLVCASCDPSGARPTGPALVPPSPHRELGGLSGAGTPVWQQEPGARSLFDGGRLFFDSGDAIVPQDTNGNTDVYEFEPAGVGSCTAADPTFNAARGGCTGLISSGRAAGESLFMEASANGSDVFFTTPEPLVAKDTDTALDVYDAHECTAASPCPASSILPPPCTTEASCIAPPSPQPSIFGPPSSATFSGPGNILPKPKPKTAAQIRAEKLSKALASCRHRYKRQRKRRAACEKQAHRAYGAAKKAKRAGKSAHANRRAK